MGQYYVIANIDRQEYLYPFDYDDGLKLMEWSYNNRPIVHALLNLLFDEWKGDRVYVVGDYADLSNPGENWCGAYKDALEHFGLDDDVSLYNFVHRQFRAVRPNDMECESYSGRDYNLSELTASTADNEYRYIINRAAKQYIDLNHCPIEWWWGDESTGRYGIQKIAPLPLLLAMGNDRGGGDYHAPLPGIELVGSWCDTSSSIRVAHDLSGVETAYYAELYPDFTENKERIEWTREDEILARAKEKAGVA